jgi:hypothetical protein
LCELGFSTLTDIKTKKRESLINIEEEMRVAISHIWPDIENICKNHQAKISHTKYSFQIFKFFLTFIIILLFYYFLVTNANMYGIQVLLFYFTVVFRENVIKC